MKTHRPHSIRVHARGLPATKTYRESSVVLTITLAWPTGDAEGREKSLACVAQMMHGLLDEAEREALIKHLREEAPV